MKKLEYQLNMQQLDALNGLAFWLSELSWTRQKYGDNCNELPKIRSTIDSCFDDLDKLNVPFWVQNSTIVWGEDWRRSNSEYFIDYLKTKNISVC